MKLILIPGLPLLLAGTSCKIGIWVGGNILGYLGLVAWGSRDYLFHFQPPPSSKRPGLVGIQVEEVPSTK